MMNFAIQDDLNVDQVFTAEKVEEGVFQSVFPERLADKSCLHLCEVDAWNYIHEVRLTDLLTRLDTMQGKLEIIRTKVMDHVNHLISSGVAV